MRRIIGAPQTASAEAVWQESGFLDLDTLIDAYAAPLFERIASRRSELRARMESAQPQPERAADAKVKGECRTKYKALSMPTSIPRIPAKAVENLAAQNARVELHEWSRDNITFHLLSKRVDRESTCSARTTSCA